MDIQNLPTRYGVAFDSEARHWQVRDHYLANQIIGVHGTEQAAYVQADTEERYWNLYRSPAEEVAQIMA
ncbi:MAG: hypothetical protein HQ483_09655 [Rhodospirillales bacterium]|nr:hypothetical protein [Rhodospirillales bacterium]